MSMQACAQHGNLGNLFKYQIEFSLERQQQQKQLVTTIR